MKNLGNLQSAHSAQILIPILLTSLLAAIGAPAQPAGISAAGLNQIQALHAEKLSRTPAQHKLDSQLIYAAKQRRGLAIAAGVPLLKADVKFAPDGRVLVDINATVTPAVTTMIEGVGGQVINSFPQFNAIRALVPLDQIESLAALPDVKSIRRADEGQTEVITSEGDVTHRANFARSTFGVSGAGVKIGVLSDSVDYLTNSQSSGELGSVTILPGQFGTGAGEGTAMLEIVHDLAPGAQLYYATASSSLANFAQNILNLRAAGCDIIVDDYLYHVESPFQDNIVAQAVNTVTASGALYFSAAMNSGNKNDNTSGTWEGDFADGGPAGAPVSGKGGRIHDFGGGITYDTVASGGGSIHRAILFWSDPLGASTNDYDLYVLDSTGANVLFSSTSSQTGTQDPFEFISTNNVGWRVVIVKASGDNRFLHLDTGRGRLTISTEGSTRGHSSATNAFSVAAVNVATAYPNPFTGCAANPVETFSSDGPRRVFFNANGTAITSGNYSSTGGAVRQKPDIAAADGGKTTVPGFNPFFGTSAAAPHAAAIAALLKSRNKQLTPAQIRTALTTTALDIEAAGVDRDSGAGIIMADAALQSVPAVPNPFPSATYIIGGNGNGIIDSNECNLLNVALMNGGGSTLSNLTATLTTTTPGVTVLQPFSSYSSPASATVATNITPFVVSSAIPCGTPIAFSLLLNFDGGSATNTFTLPTCESGPLLVSSNLALSNPQQIGRVNRDSTFTTCGVNKNFPGIAATTGSRSYHTHSFTNFTSTPACVDVKISTPCTSNLFVVAYLGNFNPANFAQNYLSDLGQSPPTYTEFVFNVPPQTNFTLVVHTINPGTTCSSYTLTVSGLTSPADGGGVCTPQLIASPSNHDFGLLAVGNSSTRTFTVTNSGFVTLNGTAITDPPFAVIFGSPFSVPPGQTKSVTVTFTPTNSGVFSGSVTFLSDGGNSTNALTAAAAFAPAADFTAIPVEGQHPLIVNFTDTSTGDVTNWFWNFGDGNTSTDINPTHTYTDAGSYTVTHVVIGPVGTNTLAKPGLILVTNPPPPIANFAVAPTSGFAPLTVYFTNLSVAATNSTWDFGDGAISGELNPAHVYTNTGTFSVSLTTTGPGGTNSLNRPGLVIVTNASAHYVNLACTNPSPPFATWETAATNIQDAVDVANLGDEVVVTNGVYDAGGREIQEVNGTVLNRVAVTSPLLLRSVNGPAVTIIRANPPGFPCGDAYGARCVYLSSQAMLIGFTLTNGCTSWSGAGVFCESSDSVVSNCVIAGNSAVLNCPSSPEGFPACDTIPGDASGGGAHGGTLKNCVLKENSAFVWWNGVVEAGGGGGAANSVMENCILERNHSAYGGGAVGGILNNCTLQSNVAAVYGGGADNCVLNQCNLVDNSATSGGGVSQSVLTNCTLTRNFANNGGGGGVVGGVLNNCIVYFNTAPQLPNQFGAQMNYCCTTPMPTDGLGNFTNSPLFVDSANGDFHLQANSPCINAGNNAYITNTIDLDGNSRIVGGTVDVGAYEFQTPQSLISYQWLQRYGLATDGSVDFLDTDADGMNNWQEWRAWTDPADPSSLLRMLTPAQSTNGITISWQSVAGQSYFLDRSADPAGGPSFQTIATNILGTTGTTTYTDANAQGPFFYRVGVR